MKGLKRSLRGCVGVLLAALVMAPVTAPVMASPGDDMAKIGKTPELFDSGVPRSASEELASYYTAAADRMRQMVLHPTGRTESGREFRMARAAQQIVQVDRMLSDLRKRTSAWLGDRIQGNSVIPGPMTQIIAEARKVAEQQAIDAGVRVEGQAAQGSFSLIDRRTAEVFARDLYGDLDKAATATADRAKSLLRETAQQDLGEREINRILATGALEGKPRETIKRLRDELVAVAGNTLVIPTKSGGTMNFDAGAYAEMVVRTKTRQATVVARHERLEELGLDLVVIIGRVSDSFCTAFLGQAFSLSGKHPKYPAYASLPGGGPPFHPNCSKSSRPFVEALATPKQLAVAETLDDSKTLLALKPTEAQRAYKDLQLRQQVAGRYTRT